MDLFLTIHQLTDFMPLKSYLMENSMLKNSISLTDKITVH